jgi:hypothetical protein
MFKESPFTLVLQVTKVSLLSYDKTTAKLTDLKPVTRAQMYGLIPALMTVY